MSSRKPSDLIGLAILVVSLLIGLVLIGIGYLIWLDQGASWLNFSQAVSRPTPTVSGSDNRPSIISTVPAVNRATVPPLPPTSTRFAWTPPITTDEQALDKAVSPTPPASPRPRGTVAPPDASPLAHPTYQPTTQPCDNCHQDINQAHN